MFRKFITCAGIVVGFTFCFLAIGEFVDGKDVMPLLFTLSIVFIASVCEILPRHRQRQLTTRFERALMLF